MIKSIKNFEIKELIATGGMAAIYKAVQTSLDRVVAIKVLHGHLAQDPNFIQRFEREAKAAANLKHENIVNIIDFGKDEEVYFIAMEYVEGRSLKDLITRVKVFPLEVVMTIATDICKGLEHAHERGVTHRDIKPANILIGYDGTVKIADFGLAQAQDLTSITVTGAIVGTPAYMSPEQAAGRKVDVRSDIFSMGIILYEMLTGEKPFPGENYSSVITRILTLTPKRAVEMNPLVPVELSQIVEKMMEKDIDKRFADVGKLLLDMETYARKAGIAFSRKHISRFINETDKYVKESAERRKREHFDRGVYYMNLGLEKIDDAIDEFTKVIYLDPSDVLARDYIEKLRVKKEKTVKKPEVRPTAVVSTKAPAKKKKKMPFVPVVVASAGVLLVVILFASGVFSGQKPLKLPPKIYSTVLLSSTPAGAVVSIDGRNLGLRTPARVESLAPGRHEIWLVLGGYKPYRESIETRVDAAVQLTAVLIKEKAPAVADEKFGALFIRSRPAGARVVVDDRENGQRTPCLVKRLEPGSHKVAFQMAGYAPMSVIRDVVSGKVVNLNAVLTRIQKEIQYSYLKITVNPWAKVFIDNKYVETTPIAQPIRVEAGRHLVKLTNPNLKTWTEAVDFPANQTITRSVQLAPGEGYLKITVNPWADVYVDDGFVGTTPMPRQIVLSPGKHRLKIINPNFDAYEEVITIISDETLKKHVNLRKE